MAFQYGSVVVVGASFGGLAAALRIKQVSPDVEVALVDHEEHPAPKTTGGIAHTWFEDLDLKVPREATAGTVKSVRMVSPSKFEAFFRAEEPIASVLYPEKWVEVFLEKCKELGVMMFLGHGIKGVKRYANSQKKYCWLGDETFLFPDVIVAADGANSAVGRDLGRPAIDSMDMHLGYEHTIDACSQWDQDCIHLLFSSKFAPKGYAWYFPEGLYRARVGLGIPKGLGGNPKDYFKKLIEVYPEFGKMPHKILGGQIPTAPLLKSNVQDNVLFVGDAGRFCSPLHGGGIGFAVKSGYYAGSTIGEGKSLSEYDHRWRKGLRGILKRHYVLKQLLYSWDDAKFDRFIRALSSYRQESLNPNKEMFRVVKHLVWTDPGLVPTMFVQALKMRV